MTGKVLRQRHSVYLVVVAALVPVHAVGAWAIWGARTWSTNGPVSFNAPSLYHPLPDSPPLEIVAQACEAQKSVGAPGTSYSTLKLVGGSGSHHKHAAILAQLTHRSRKQAIWPATPTSLQQGDHPSGQQLSSETRTQLGFPTALRSGTSSSARAASRNAFRQPSRYSWIWIPAGRSFQTASLSRCANSNVALRSCRVATTSTSFC